MAKNCFPDPKLCPLQISVILNKNKMSISLIFHELLFEKLIYLKFRQDVSKGIKEKSEILETLGERVLEFWLPVWWRGPKSSNPSPR